MLDLPAGAVGARCSQDESLPSELSSRWLWEWKPAAAGEGETDAAGAASLPPRDLLPALGVFLHHNLALNYRVTGAPGLGLVIL